jgi:asparagine synthase (glutamine-hydrolysing)
MCGIAGLFWSDPARPADAALLGRLGDTLFHRGPDGGGAYTDGPLGIAMRRLSIIDLATGDQPLANEDGSVWTVFNGEIYNYREITRDLVGRGHRFKTASDTEVLVHLYEEYGERCVDRLRGMFAFAIWDTRKQSLLLARDRLGIKPLYYGETAEGFAFGSELKTLTQVPWLPRTVDPAAVVAYLQRGYVPDPATILKGVVKLPPGHTVVVRRGHAEAPRRYWDSTAAFRERAAGTDAEAAEALWGLVGDAVRSHLVSDVPVGAFLSGGIDSSAVVAAMAREAGAPIKTFSIGFAEIAYSELPYARRVAESFGTEHHELVVEPSHLSALDDVLAAFDEPFADASAIPTYFVSQLARAHVKVVLSGDGGDEIFAGYDRYLVDHRRRRVGLLGDLGLGAPLRMVSRRMPEGTPGKKYLYNLSLPRMERYLDAITLFPPAALDDVLGAGASRAASGDPAAEARRGLDPLSRLQSFDMDTYLPGDILTKVDRMTMAHSLEARVPLLDHELVEFASRLPPRLRMQGGQTKALFKKTLRGRVPDEVLDRPKQGFAVPLEIWFSQKLPTFFPDALQDGGRLADVGIRPAAVRRLLDLYAERRRDDHCRRLWALLVLDRFLRRLAN